MAPDGRPQPLLDEPIDITPVEVRERLDSGERLRMLDIREPDEVELARIDGAVRCPLSHLVAGRVELPDPGPTVVFCHHGIRSAWLVSTLRDRGWDEVWNLAGGIEAWAREVDPTVPRY